MAEQSHQPSSFVFPVALQPAYEEPEVRRTQHPGWGWVELFVLAGDFSAGDHVKVAVHGEALRFAKAG